MRLTKFNVLIVLTLTVFAISCKDEDPPQNTLDLSAIKAKFGHSFDIENLPDYANQTIPSYITRDNTNTNSITDKGASLGRVLFYDKLLSVDETVSCASCHKQEFAFGDDASASVGVNGTTGRHSMRLVNARFSEELKFFWDERAANLEEQTTMPIQDHGEMGYSGENGDPSLEDLIAILQEVDYYQEFFELVYGDPTITESRMQLALSQFVRSLQSFDSKFDEGRQNANNNGAPFTNFTVNENAGKALFLQPPTFDGTGTRTAGGAGCGGCHRAPEFDIDPDSRNNGIIGSIGGGQDLTNTKAPTLRDIINDQGTLNGNLMHNASFGALQGVIAHYNNIPGDNANLDNRLKPGGNLQNLALTTQERQQLLSFLQTLTGSDIYTNAKWSDPF